MDKASDNSINKAASTGAALKILIADDNELIRNGIRLILESCPNWLVCGEAHNGPDAVEKAVELQPDVILIDISMPQMNGFEAAKRIHERVPGAQILMVSEHDSHSLAQAGTQPGVSGYVQKSRLGIDLISTIESLTNQRCEAPIASD